MEISQRVIGCLMGGALGDAWGGPSEGHKGPIPFQIPEYPRLSDDTQLTLATCEAIIEAEEASPELIAARFGAWYREGRVHGAGASTTKALSELAFGGHWALTGAKGEFAAGGGAAMRAAPLAFVLDPDNFAARRTLRDICRITHHSEEAYVGALAVVITLRLVMAGAWPDCGSLLEAVLSRLPDSRVRDRLQQLVNCNDEPLLVARQFESSGHVANVVPLAIYAAQRIQEQPLETVLRSTIAAGGDTDTIASICGQIAGCVIGASGVPAEALNAIAGISQVQGIVTDFVEFLIRDTR